jgi:serine/threonine protein kinase
MSAQDVEDEARNDNVDYQSESDSSSESDMGSSGSVSSDFDESAVPHVKIVDFGFARRLATPVAAARGAGDDDGGDDDALHRAPRLGDVPVSLNLSFLGTPKYTAPEVLQYQQYDCRVDMYAIGVILYSLIAGDFPVEEQVGHGSDEIGGGGGGDGAASEEGGNVVINALLNRLKHHDKRRTKRTSASSSSKSSPKPIAQQERAALKFPDAQWRHSSAAIRDLLSHLIVDEAHRYTAEQFLLHPWVRVAYRGLSASSAAAGVMPSRHRRNVLHRKRRLSKLNRLIDKTRGDDVIDSSEIRLAIPQAK